MSGIRWDAQALYKLFPKSVEVQLQHENAGDFWCIAQNITTADMETRRGERDNWGTTEGKLRRIRKLVAGAEKHPGEWNEVTIECVGDRIKVWVNGVIMNYGEYCEATHGKIALQSEGAEVEFSKIELTRITTLSER